MSPGGGGRSRKRQGLRTGYTTGANATAAAMAATLALVNQEPQAKVTIHLPIEQDVTFKLHSCSFDRESARCSCIKDAGDDPDVTHGAEIGATVSWSDRPGITLEAGPGVGTVTKPGLGLEVGSPAINPVPREMITTHVAAAAGQLLNHRGLRVQIWVTDGEKLARRTLNGRLGIVGGLSILGTTGVVVPYSTTAYQASIAQGMEVALAQGATHLVLNTGGRSERFSRALLPHLPEAAFVQMGEFLGWSLKAATRYPSITRVTVGAMIGKMSKIAQGHFHLHVSQSQVDFPFLARVAAECGAPARVQAEIAGANTARHVQEISRREGLDRLFPRICELAALQMREYVKASYTVEALLLDFDGTLLGRAEAAPRTYDPAEVAAARAAIPDGDDAP